MVSKHQAWHPMGFILLNTVQQVNRDHSGFLVHFIENQPKKQNHKANDGNPVTGDKWEHFTHLSILLYTLCHLHPTTTLWVGTALA